jgi:hypothetical protein
VPTPSLTIVLPVHEDVTHQNGVWRCGTRF